MKTKQANMIIKENTIEFYAGSDSSVLGRLFRLVMFPIKWVLFGKASL